ncbi:hypothetical protein N657DRAFT_651643 [Parathielavia appendiculata]|uniref:Uncharacterized protein n=1 Tax=Parathielavia appendiculata TaxID=2587402 RepID=A0AAN6YXT1_9PEZI|nr:hypothetical protein N657DRAFT_651643 [Parathielavia appendiculata]
MERVGLDTCGHLEQEQEQMQDPNRSLALESLPTEVLVALLSAAHSTADLRSLISASPRLYQIFVSAKREVLLSIVTNDLGAALRDAVAALLLTPTRLNCRGPTYLDECERVIRRYEALPHGADGALSSTIALPTAAVIQLSRLNRSVQFLVDEFAESRLPELRKIHPDAGGPLTPAERRRLARALLRHQVLARIEYGDRLLRVEAGEHLPRETAMMHRFLRLFKPWKIEQLAEAHSFLNELVWRAFPPLRGLPSLDQRVSQQWDRKRDAAFDDLCGLHGALVEAERAHSNSTSNNLGPRRFRAIPPAGMVLTARFRFLRAGPLPGHSAGSHSVAREFRPLRDELYRHEDALPQLVYEGDGNDDAAPPFAWVDGHGGLDCQRWGDQVRREVVPGEEEQEEEGTSTARQRIWVRENRDRWRWLGFVFYDRRRVELLKTRIPVYETGWLTAAPPSDEELQESYDKARLAQPKPTRPSRRANATRGG